MRKTRVLITLGCCMIAMAGVAMAQGTPKAGLWESTTTMNFTKSPLPPGMTAPAGSPFSGAPRTMQVCVTQAQIDRFGGPNPFPSHGSCSATDVQKTLTGMTANMVCTGQMAGNGTVVVKWSGDGTGSSTVHFTGSMQSSHGTSPVEFTVQTNSVYKGADCGSVKPVTPPAGN